MVTTITAATVAPQDLDVLQTAAAQLPEESSMHALLDQLRTTLEAGGSATLLEQDAELSPNKAAELIGVSRPFLLRFMDSGALKYTNVATHRRIALSDLLEFNKRRLAAGKAVAEAVANQAAHHAAVLDEIAPISDEALADLDNL